MIQHNIIGHNSILLLDGESLIDYDMISKVW